MLLVSGLLLALILLMRFGPEIPFTRVLNEQLAERPSRWLSRRERHDWLFFAIVLAMAVPGGEMIAVLGPEFALVYAADLALYLDFVLVSSLLAVVAHVKAAARAVQLQLSRLAARALRLCRPASRGRASHRHAARRPPANDDDEGSLPLAA